MADKPLADKWAHRDFPVLVEATRRRDDGEDFIADDSVAEELGLDVDEVRKAFAALERRGLVTVENSFGGPIFVTEVSGQAYLLTGLHPDGDDEADRLVSLLRQAADQASDPEEKSRLRRAASAVGDLVGTVGAGVMTAYATSLLPS